MRKGTAKCATANFLGQGFLLPAQAQRTVDEGQLGAREP